VMQSPGYSGSDCYTGWTSKSSWLIEAREVDPVKERWVTKEGHGPVDGRDSGYITKRELTFTKKTSTSRMFMTYNDNLRVYGKNKACRWEIRIDGKPCPSGLIAGDIYVVNDNPHRHHDLMGFCDGISAGNHKMQIMVGQTPGYSGSDCYTGWQASSTWVMDAREVEPNSPLTGITGHAGNDGRDSGWVSGRTLEIKKHSDSTNLRLTYQDNFRVYGSGKACYWEIRVDGQPCKTGTIRGDKHVAGSENTHRFHAIIGYCNGVKKGTHKIQAYVGQINGGADCYTGWNSGSSWTLASEEIAKLVAPPPPPAPKPVPGGAYIFKHGPQDGRDSGDISGRTLTFKKKSAKTRLMITYNDNLRVYGNGKACRWVVKVDGGNCKNGIIATDMHVSNNNNDHSPHVLMGICDGLSAGNHNIKAHVMQSPGYSGSDCYTGWTSSSSWLLEAREVDPVKDNWNQKEGHGPVDGRDSGYITHRDFYFTKKAGTSRMMLTYNDNLRVYGRNKACRWEIRIDGKPCPSGRIAGDIYVVNDNPHRHHDLIGFCDGISAGKRRMQIMVGQTPGYSGSDCYTGWQASSTWLMDAREVPQNSVVYGLTGHAGNDGRDSGYVSGRTLVINKKSSSSRLRLTYQDNFRVYGSGKACYWEIRVDGKSCSTGRIRGDKHVSGSENTHRFHAIIGYCKNVGKGTRKIQAYVGQINGGADCYTGWNSGSSWTLAAEEETD